MKLCSSVQVRKEGTTSRARARKVRETHLNCAKQESKKVTQTIAPGKPVTSAQSSQVCEMLLIFVMDQALHDEI